MRIRAPSNISNRSRSDHIDESIMRYKSQNNAKTSASVVQTSVESLRGLKKADESQQSRLQNRMIVRGLPSNRSVRSVVQNTEIISKATNKGKESRASIQQKIASIKSQKNLASNLMNNQGFLSNRSNNQKKTMYSAASNINFQS